MMENNRPCIRCGKVPADGWYSKSGYCRACAGEMVKAKEPYACSQKDWLVTLLLAIFVGGLGIHRFYAGKIGTGILWLLTGGCFFVGWLIDVIMIATNSFADGDGKKILSDSAKREIGISSPSAYVSPKAEQSKSYVEQLEQLAKLRDSGVLTEEEFQAKKTQILEKIG